VQILADQVSPKQILSGPRQNSTVLLPCALFVVRDNGSGMDAATQAHLFEAFFTTKRDKGTGLGLSTVYKIVTSNGGLIHIDSAPGCGTRVTILLPLVPTMVTNSQPVTGQDRGGISTKEEKEETP
jgi:signal transduction histidine kinase